MNLLILLADVVSVLHAGFSIFVLLGLMAFVGGRLLRWAWTDHKALRFLHMIAVIAIFLRVMAGLSCPFSRWEDGLRTAAGQQLSELNPPRQFLRKLAFRGARESRFEAGLLALGFATLLVHLDWLRRRSLQLSQTPETFSGRS